jgi:hypothetical protein
LGRSIWAADSRWLADFLPIGKAVCQQLPADVHAVLSKDPFTIWLVHSTQAVGALGLYVLLQSRVELAWPLVARLPQPLRGGVLAHELAHRYLIYTEPKRWRDEDAVDAVTAEWGFDMQGLRRAAMRATLFTGS